MKEGEKAPSVWRGFFSTTGFAMVTALAGFGWMTMRPLRHNWKEAIAGWIVEFGLG